jgi:hypothetical protein
MQQRSIVKLIVLSIITFGIYSLVWMVSTKNEMNERGAEIPTAWLGLVPIVGFWWMWKYCGGVEKVTGGKTSQVLAFILLAVLGVIGMAIIQDGFNKSAGHGTLATARAV